MDSLIRHSATGLALPNVPIDADLDLQARRATSWRSGARRYVLLEGRVKIGIGAYGFRASSAVVRITPRDRSGRSVREVAIYLDEARTLGGRGPTRQRAERLLATATLTGEVSLTTDLMRRRTADENPLVVAARRRIDRYRQSLARNTVESPAGEPLFPPDVMARRTERAKRIEEESAAPLPKPGEGETAEAKPTPPASREAGPAAALPGGRVDFRADRVEYRKGEDNGYVLLMGNIQVMYADPRSDRRLTLRADQGVLFTDPQALSAAGGGSVGAEKIRGVYLEDHVVASDGAYTLRGPRVFYDLTRDKAVVLDAVFYTWNERRQVPLYVRARQLRQHSRRQWSARGARLTTSEFAEPHFSIGANKLTINAEAGADGEQRTRYTARGVTLNVGETPVFYWPALSGTAAETPLRSVNAGYGTERGAVLETRWDLPALLDLEPSENADATLLLDGYSERGGAVGVDLDYDTREVFGDLDAYYLYDTGEDEPGSRLTVEPPSSHRGRLSWRHRQQLSEEWEATAELAWISDPTFLEEWFPAEAHAEKQSETLLYLKRQHDDSAFTFLTKYDLIDFIPQSYQLQTRGNIPGGLDAPSIGYSTQKLPELAYHRIGAPLWGDRLTWYSENRASVMRLNLPEIDADDLGFRRGSARTIFGLLGPGNTGIPFDQALRESGLDENIVHRFDTRQEVQAPLDAGVFNITPYATGRITAYDDDFEAYRGNDRNVRLWGAAGVRVGTSFSRSWDGVDNRLLGLHRLRHVVEPGVNLFFAGTSIDQRQLPVYDYDVESLAEGGIARFSVRNTLQTQRGGPGRWRSVDWIRLDTHVAFASDDTQRESPIGRFLTYRPELGLSGDFVYNELAWQASDTLAFVANTNYSLDDSRLEQWNLGLTLDHTPRLTTFVNYRDIDALESSIIQYGADYLLTPKYHASFAQSYDLARNRSRALGLTLTRRLPRFLLMVQLDFNTIDDTTSVGVALAPEGFGGVGGPGLNPFLQR